MNLFQKVMFIEKLAIKSQSRNRGIVVLVKPTIGHDTRSQQELDETIRYSVANNIQYTDGKFFIKYLPGCGELKKAGNNKLEKMQCFGHSSF